MRHLEPRQSAPVALRGEPKPTGALAWLVAATFLTVGCGAAAGWVFGSKTSDKVAKSEVQERQLAFGQTEPLRVNGVAREQTGLAIQSMRLDPPQQAQLQEMAQPAMRGVGATAARPGVRLVQITVWDTHAEDGDVVALVSAGYRREVVLTHAPQTITLPVDANSQLLLIGVHDGGGGITLGVGGAGQQVLMPIMSEGQTLALPLAR